jgi:hypothetical protein
MKSAKIQGIFGETSPEAGKANSPKAAALLFFAQRGTQRAQRQ